MKRLAIVVVLAGLPGCGDPESSLCDGRPCRTSIDDLADWTAVSTAHVPDERCDFLEESKFIAPATAGAALQEIVFQDVEAHRLHLDFMTQVLPEYFGGLSPETYQEIVQVRATRQYWAGALFRLVDTGGVTTGYGFDVVTGHGWEDELTEDDVAAIAPLLERRFHLPLVYAPSGAHRLFEAINFNTVDKHLPIDCHETTCPTPGTDCVVVPAPLELCGHFHENRTIETELANKARVTIDAGTLELPHELGTYTVPAIIRGGELGPARTPIIPAGTTARYEVSVPFPGYVNRIYTQDFTAGGEPYQIMLSGADGGRLFDDYVQRGPFTRLTPTGTTTNERWAYLGSCTATNLEPYQIRGDLGGGDRFTVDFGYWPMFFGSSPMFVTRAEVTLGGTTVVVDDYFRLVYAGEHHNWNNQFQILFDTPITYAGHPVYGLWIDQASSNWDLDAVYTLDDQRGALDTLAVTGYGVERL